MKNLINEQSVPDLRTYEDYVDLGKVNTRRYLMLSELIDNSISSFDTEYGEGNWGKKLEIIITIDNLIEPTKVFNGIEYFPSSTLIVEDNAFGISRDNLIDTLRLNKKNIAKTSKMNVHGRGLKQSAFYFGLGVQVISMHRDSNEIFTVENKPIEKGLTTEVVYQTFEYEGKIPRGTRIIIDCLRKSHRFTNFRLNEVFEALSYRYSKLISSENMSIKFKYRIDENNKWDEKEILNPPDDVAKISEDFEYDKELKIAITNSAKNKVKKLIEKATEKRNIHKYPELAEITSEKLSEIINSEDDNTRFEWTQNIEINDKEVVEMKFWLISTDQKSYSNKRGIRVDEGDRSILHPPIIANEVSTYLDPLPKTNRSGSVDNRFAGQVNISDFSAQTTTDKSTFEFKDQEDKGRFDDQISVIFDVFEQFVLQGRSGNKNSVAASFTSEDEDKLEATILSKFRGMVKAIEFNDEKRNSLNSTIIFDKKEYVLSIKIDDKPTPSDILRVRIKEEELKVDAIWFNNHNIWKNINENKNFNVEAMIPMFLLLVFQEMQFQKKINEFKEFTQKDKEYISPSQNINDMSKEIK